MNLCPHDPRSPARIPCRRDPSLPDDVTPGEEGPGRGGKTEDYGGAGTGEVGGDRRQRVGSVVGPSSSWDTPHETGSEGGVGHWILEAYPVGFRTGGQPRM